MVALRRVVSEEDTNEAEVSTIDIWVQLHDALLSKIALAAIPNLHVDLGDPISEAQHIFFRDLRAYRIRMRLPLEKALWDKIEIENHLIRDGVIYLVYGRVLKICFFCGKLGHSQEVCGLRERLMRRRALDVNRENSALWSILDMSVGEWVLDKTKLPLIRARVEKKLDNMSHNPDEFQGLHGWDRGRRAMSGPGTTNNGRFLQELDTLDDEDVISTRKHLVKVNVLKENGMVVDSAVTKMKHAMFKKIL